MAACGCTALQSLHIHLGETIPLDLAAWPIELSCMQALAHEECKAKHTDPLEIDYHATRLAHLKAGEAAVRYPDEPAYNAEVISNEKRTIRYRFKDCNHSLPEAQWRIRPADRRVAKTRRELADKVSEDLSTKLKDLEKDGKTLFYHDKPVRFEDIVLLSVVFYSKGCIRPRLAVVCERSDVWNAVEQALGPPLLPHDVL
ncbi:hypothetical protein C8Q73DRAFT_409591 [Cubamyces lactineus]|nr:hypothetical protein C8Q73DRAFT_409591 [Cubamyces lactineus]